MKSRFAVIAVLALAMAAMASVPASDLSVRSEQPRLDPTTVDVIGTPGQTPPAPTDGFSYTIEWHLNVPHLGVVGLTPVQDTMLWVSSGGATGSPDTNMMLIYNLNTMTLVDSFKQFVPNATSAWGYRDMAYDPVTNYVYAGYETNKLHVIDATAKTLVGNYTVTGSALPTIVRALGFDGDSLFAANFTTSPVSKFSTTGTGCHQVAPVPPVALYGLAVNNAKTEVYGTTGDNSYRILRYNYTSGNWTVKDTTTISEILLFGGCEMWRNDTFLLVVDQTSDSIVCLRLIAGASADVGATAVLSPKNQIAPGAVAPKVQIRNFGSAAQSNIPVYCWIDSGATRVYNQTVTYTGSLAPGATDSIAFPNWTPGPIGSSYNVTMFTALPGDGNPANDTVRATTAVMGYDLVWYARTTAPAPARYWSPGHGAVRDTIYYCGGRQADAASVRTIFAYDIAGATWITAGLPALPTPRRAGAGGRIGNKIYFAGGRDSASTTLNTCQEFDVDAKTVTAKANMPLASWASCGAVAGDKLYVVGSENRVGNTYEYDPVANTWATKASCPVGRGWASAIGAGGKLYVTGGSGTADLKDCWVFDPVANTWTQKADMPGTREYHVSVSYLDSVIFVLGGSTTGSSPADKLVYKYDIAANTWSTETPMITARGWMMPNVVDNSIWVAYGSDCTTPTYLLNLEEGIIPMTGIEEYRLGPQPASLVIQTPVRDRARVRFSIPQSGRVHLGVYDATGSLVRTLLSGPLESGAHLVDWNRTAHNGSRVAAGTYFCRLTVDGRSASTKAVVLD